MGDTLTLPVLEHFLPGRQLEVCAEDEGGKVVAIGSILHNARPGDTVWGTGAMKGDSCPAGISNVRFKAVRGLLTKSLIEYHGGVCPPVFGDPALLLPLMYSPSIERRFALGVIPHFVDYPKVGRNFGWDDDRLLIDVFTPWKRFVDLVLSCERIISSSLHGLVIAEAYGIPAKWQRFSDHRMASVFKFHDYLTGTGRPYQDPGILPPIRNLAEIQRGLIDALRDV